MIKSKIYVVSTHRGSQINKGGGFNQLLYRHSICRIIRPLNESSYSQEDIYHHKKPSLSNPFRRKREEHWIRQMGTAAQYGCNDHIDGIGKLTSTRCQSVNVLNLFE